MELENGLGTTVKKYLIRGGGWALSGKIINAVMGLLLFTQLSRLLSPIDMGLYFLALNFATFFSIFSRMGLENTLLRFVSEAMSRGDHECARLVIKKGVQLSIYSTGIVVVALNSNFWVWLSVDVLHSKSLSEIGFYISIWVVFISYRIIYSDIFRAFQDIRNAVLWGGLVSAIGIVSIITILKLVIDQVTLVGVLAVVLSVGWMGWVISSWVLLKKIKLLSNQYSSYKYDSIGIFNHSWPLFINTLTLFVLSQSDLWIVGMFCTQEEVAVYGASTRLVILTSMTLNVVNAVIPPLVSRLYDRSNPHELEVLLRKVATIAAVPAVGILGIYVFASDWVMGFVFSERYYSGGVFLLILSFGQLVNVLVGSCGYTLIMTGHRKVLMCISIFSSLVAVLSGLLLVNIFGAIGVAIGFSTGMVIQQVLMLISARMYCGIWTHVDFQYLVTPIKSRLG